MLKQHHACISMSRKGNPYDNAACYPREPGICELRFGSSGRTRTYNPSVNSRTAYSRLALQTQVLAQAKCGLSR